MGKVVEKKRKKKKGRPSLLDLQKRNLRLQKQQEQEQQQQQNKRNPNPNPNLNPSPNLYANPRNPNPTRRFTRRNPISDDAAASPERADDGADDDDDEEEDEEEEDLNGRRRREKKLKFVLRLPSNQQNHGSLSDSPYLNWGLYGSDSNAEEEEENVEAPKKKRKINAVRHHGSGRGSHGEKGEKKQYSTSKTTGTNLGSSIEAGPTTALPDKKLLVFILDRLQKKDTYGVFSEPVDPNELPDYHEVIKHPMDFSTVRKKLNAGAYSNLEEFEKDVFLICTNAMQYNAPDTIYFRQARSMHELAKKDFENLRQDSDDNEPEPEPKVAARRGRPPTKKVKKPSGKALFERAGSEFSSDATLATAGENGGLSNMYNLRKGPISDKFGVNDAPGRASRNNEPYSSWLSERHDEFPGSIPKGFSSKFGKKQLVIDENRRSTYNRYQQSTVGQEPSVLTTFDVEKKHLMAVGLHTEHGYARSLARYAANLGPVAWNVASKKIARALPAGVNFGPGWVVENESQVKQLPPSTVSPQQTMAQQPCPSFASSSNTPPPTTSSLVADGNASMGDKLLNNPVLYSLKNRTFPMSTSVTLSTTPPTSSTVISEGSKSLEEKLLNNPVLDSLRSRTFPISSSSSSSSAINRFHPESITKCHETGRLNNVSGSDSISISGSVMRPPFQVNQSYPMLNPALNGLSGGFCASLVSQMTKSTSPAWQSGSYSSGSNASLPSQRLDILSRNNFATSMQLETQNPMISGSLNSVISNTSSPNAAGIGTPSGPGASVHLQPSWQALSTQHRPDSAPPDLNLRFQSPGSPKTGARADSPQTDLALQL